MEQFLVPSKGNLSVVSMRELCLKNISRNLAVDCQTNVQCFLTHLLPEDVLEVIDQCITMHGVQVNICPYRLLLPRPCVFLQAPLLRGKLLRICRYATQDTASSTARDMVIDEISLTNSAKLPGLMELGAFLCEMGWYEDGAAILERIHKTLAADPSCQHPEMALDCAYRQLSAAVSEGRVLAARQLSARVSQLTGSGVGRRSGLLSAAAAALARLHILTESWPEAGRWLCAALDGLPAVLPADLAAELPRLAAELLLGCGQSAALMELAPQALAATCRHWGELHPQTLAALKMMADFAMASGMSGVAQDLSERVERLTGELFGVSSAPRQRARLDRVLVAMRLASGEDAAGPARASAVRPGSLPVPGDSCWTLDRSVADCQWLDEHIPPLLSSPLGIPRALQLSRQIVAQLEEAARHCEVVFGPDSLRLARVLTELGRQYFSLGMDGLLEAHADGTDKSERLLRRALEIQGRHGLARDHRDSLVTQITLACLYTYSSMPFLLEGERLLKDALSVCYGGERRQHLDLVEHCLRGLSYIYARHEDTVRTDAMDDVLGTVQTLRRRLGGQRVSHAGVAALLPRRPWTDGQILQQLSAACQRYRR